MRSACWLLVILTGAFVTGKAQAQGLFGFPGVGFGRVSVSAGFGPVRYRVSYAAPFYPGYVTPGYGYYSTIPSFTQVNYYAPPAIVLEVPQEPQPRETDRQIPPRWEQELLRREPPRDDRALPGGRPVSVTRPIGFDNRAQALRLPPKELPKAAEPRPKPERKPALVPEADQPQDDPRKEAARLVRLGKEAFAEQEYGRASQRFRQAVELRPQDAMPYFLLAKAQLALGKYAEAVAAIHSGMRLQPDWPTERFPPAELYGARIGFFRTHLLELEDTLAKHPQDWVLLFLLGHEMWFDGRQEEALLLFRRAAATAPDKQGIERFLAP